MRRSRIPGVARCAVAVAGLAAGASALSVALGAARATSYAGRSVAGATLTAVVAGSLAVAGLAGSMSERHRRAGDVALLTIFAWVAPVWVGWVEGPPLIRAAGAALAGFILPFALHLLLMLAPARYRSPVDSVLLLTTYAEAVLVATALALFRDPYADPSCFANCSTNPLLLHPLPTFVSRVEAADRAFLIAAGVCVAVASLRCVGSSSPVVRRRTAAAGGAVIVISVAAVARAILLWSRPVEDPARNSLLAVYVIQGLALLSLAAVLIAALLRGQRERRSVAHIVADLDKEQAPGALQAALAKTLGDPDLTVAYWLPETQRYVDSRGRAVPEPTAGRGQIVTRLTREKRTVAVVAHAGTSGQLERELGAAIGLGLDNERLQAQVLSELDSIRVSRTRIVELGDAERRRLERDLHDGAQQRLLALSYDLRRAQTSARDDGDAATEAILRRAVDETREALEELRELARGIFPAVLSELGLAAALATLADMAPLPVVVAVDPVGRHSLAVESAAYFAVAHTVADAHRRGAEHVVVGCGAVDGLLTLDMQDNGSVRDEPLVTVADRIGALGGRVFQIGTDVRIEIPCG